MYLRIGILPVFVCQFPKSNLKLFNIPHVKGYLGDMILIEEGDPSRTHFVCYSFHDNFCNLIGNNNNPFPFKARFGPVNSLVLLNLDWVAMAWPDIPHMLYIPKRFWVKLGTWYLQSSWKILRLQKDIGTQLESARRKPDPHSYCFYLMFQLIFLACHQQRYMEMRLGAAMSIFHFAKCGAQWWWTIQFVPAPHAINMRSQVEGPGLAEAGQAAQEPTWRT